MKKRIFIGFFIMVLVCVVLLSASVSLILYNATRSREIDGVRDRANIAAEFLNNSIIHDDTFQFSYYDTDGARVTLISYDGTVLLDNKQNPTTLDNHGDREEFEGAIKNGRGESTRYSITLGSETYYYAIRLTNGDVIRVSKTMDRIAGVFSNVFISFVGITILVLIIAGILASRLTRSIIRPFNDIDFDSSNMDVYDELIPYVRKIDQQKSEIANQIVMLQNRAETIETITDNMKEGLILIDKDGVILAINKSALDVFSGKDLTGKYLIGKNILHIHRDADFQEYVKKCLSGENAEITIERSGKIYSVFFSPVHDYEITGGVILFQDISEKHELEKQRREFSANVSHELKTPLTTITATAELLENDMVKGEDIKAFAGKITVQADRLINIIDDIIKLSEFDEGGIVSDNTEFDLYDLALSVIEALQQKADEKHVTITLEGVPFKVSAKKQMIDELLFNLIDNAINYNKDAGRITVSLSKESDKYNITVSDTGIGIPEEHRERIFERFYRVDKSRSKKTGGTGLGLSIVKHITELHKGSVILRSTTEAGTTVECSFPDCLS